MKLIQFFSLFVCVTALVTGCAGEKACCSSKPACGHKCCIEQHTDCAHCTVCSAKK